MSGDDLIGDILRATASGQPEQRDPASGFSAVLGRAVGAVERQAPRAAAPPLDDLAALSQAQWRVLLRYLGDEQLVPLLADAPSVVTAGAVAALDEEARAWLRSQTAEYRKVDARTHADAAQRALTLLRRLRDDGKLDEEPDAVAPAPSATVDRVGSSTLGMELDVAVPAPAAPTSAPAPQSPPVADAGPQGDALLDALAGLVDAARGCDAAGLHALGEALDDPVLSRGLGLIAADADAHGLREALDQLEYDALHDVRRRFAMLREALLAIRFGENGASFRKRS